MHGYTDGHAHCGNHAGAMILTMGVSNDRDNTTQLGQAWANEVHQANVVFSGAQSILQVWGSDDIEGGFSAVGPVQQWIAGYDSQHSIPLVDRGQRGPLPSGPNATCNAHSERQSCNPNGVPIYSPACSHQWAQGDYWSLGVPFGGHDQLAFPQIYCSSEAAQWQAISRWGAQNKRRPDCFHSDLTEGGTGSCNTWSTGQGYTATSALLSDLNGSGQTKQGNIPYMQIVRPVG